MAPPVPGCALPAPLGGTALADAEVTARLLLRMQRDVGQRFALPLRGAPASHALLMALQRAARSGLERCVGHEASWSA